MPDFTEHIAGMPCWIDTNVETRDQREALIKFYSALFGWTFEVGPVESGAYSTAFYKGRAVLAIGEQAGGQGDWVTYFSTDDIDQSVGRVKENGGQILIGPRQVKEFGFWAVAKDCTGAVHGLWQPASFPGFGAMFEANAPSWFGHVSEDAHAAVEYYQRVLGDGIGLHVEGEMQILRREGRWFASITEEDCSVIAPRWSPVFGVDSLDRFRDSVCDLGGRIIVEEMPVAGSTISTFQEPIMGSFVTVMADGSS